MKVKELLELIIPEQRLDVSFFNNKGYSISSDDALDKEVIKISSQSVICRKERNTIKIRGTINIYIKDDKNV